MLKQNAPHSDYILLFLILRMEFLALENCNILLHLLENYGVQVQMQVIGGL